MERGKERMDGRGLINWPLIPSTDAEGSGCVRELLEEMICETV